MDGASVSEMQVEGDFEDLERKCRDLKGLSKNSWKYEWERGNEEERKRKQWNKILKKKNRKRLHQQGVEAHLYKSFFYFCSFG